MEPETGGYPETVIDRLVEAGVTVPVEGDWVQLTSEFSARIEDRLERLSQLDETELVERLTSITGIDEESARLLERSPASVEILAEHLALRSVDDLSRDDRVRALIAFDSLRWSPPPDDGAPGPFVPVRGERVPFLAPMYDRAIVYVWKVDCPPCDLMSAEFEATFETPPDDIALFAVSGPDAARVLFDYYQVDGAPTTLFFLGGNVDARLRGAHYQPVIENEIEILREQTPLPR